ncbi:MFS transporter [Sporobolomyces koalae]|uniref:MFS transporter n=1 Tax=Sporobolomyces koalae TaxID=500713 RepID=UPI0031719232
MLDDEAEKDTIATAFDDHTATAESKAATATSPMPRLPPGLLLTALPKSRLLLTFTDVPAHPEDPLCRSLPSKIWVTLVAALLVMIQALPLSMYLIGYIVGPFFVAPLSETYGRRPLFIVGILSFTVFMAATGAAPSYGALLAFRWLSGIAGAVPMTNSGAVCGDIWSATQRGTAMSFYSVATFAGPALGPVVAAFAALRFGWPWAFYIPAIIAGGLAVVVILALPETYPPAILTRIATSLRQETGDERIVSSIEIAALDARQKRKWGRCKAEAYRLLAMPFVLLLTEIIIGLLTAYMSMVYGLIYLLFEGYPVIFSDIHNLAPGYSSLPFLSTFVGAILSVPLTLWYQRRYIRAKKHNHGVSTPEMRLPPAEAGGVLIVISFLWLGWSGNYASVPWIVPTLSGVVQGIGSVLIFRSLQTYLIDAYERYAASALASNVVARSISGAVFPLFARAMFRKLGVGVACTILAVLMALLVPVPFIFERYGARLRKRSNFAPKR